MVEDDCVGMVPRAQNWFAVPARLLVRCDAWHHPMKSSTLGVSVMNSRLAVYRATKSFPTEEQYSLTSQTRRAAFSAAVNIVEGSSRRSRKEFRRFLDISLSSLTEVGYALRFSREAGLLPDEDWSALNDRQCRARFLTWQLYRALAR